MNELKLSIQKLLDEEDFSQAKSLIERYEEEYPADLDVFAMKSMYELYSGNLEAAVSYAQQGVRRYPNNADLYYNLGNVYESLGEWFQAWYAYGRAYIIYTYIKDEKAETLDLINLIAQCRQLHETQSGGQNFAGCEEVLENAYGLFEDAFRSSERQILGHYYWESVLEKRYAGYYSDFLSLYGAGNLNVRQTKGEFLKVTEGNTFEISIGDSEVLLPIAVEDAETLHKIVHDEKEYNVKQALSKHFNYYRLPADSKIFSSGKAYYGKPIVLHQEADKKKLVLNLFVDGLAQCILDGEELQRIMPHTARFFGEGTICERAYSTAEWTYPSIASYVTGLEVTHHMMFHNELDSAIPADCPTLAEYFQEKGYFTAMTGGDWRIIPTYGHARGYDSFIYQQMRPGCSTEEMVGEVIDHLETFQETNQFLWVSFGDLHEVADGLQLPNAVQSTLGLEDCVEEERGKTSVKQGYSENKRTMFQKSAHRMDVLLNVIYQYVESNYKDEDILISLFADHGQGYLIPTGGHFCSEGRSRIALMFRGDKVPKQVCREVISANDYIKIMCHLADIKMKDAAIDGVLPRTFGGSGREYALMESLHPNDPYQAAVYAKDSVFYFTNPSPVQYDGRFYLEKYQAELKDLQGNSIEDREKYEKYLRMVLEHIAPLLIV